MVEQSSIRADNGMVSSAVVAPGDGSEQPPSQGAVSGTSATEPGQASAGAPEAPESTGEARHKVKWRDPETGKRIEQELTVEEMAKDWQLAKRSKQLISKATEYRQAAQTVLNLAENDIGQLLPRLAEGSVYRGLIAMAESPDPRVQQEVAKAFGELFELQQMPEDKRRLREVEKREAMLRRQEEERERRQKEAHAQAQAERDRQFLIKSFRREFRGHNIDVKALGEEGAHLIRETARLLEDLAPDNAEDLHPEDIAEAVAEVARRHHQATKPAPTSPEDLFSSLDENSRATLKRLLLDEAKAAASAPPPSSNGARPPAVEKRRRFVSTEDLRRDRWNR